ncbi:MAG: radical SAM protein [Candidatus Lokiarchaeota archaeon]|nr:radical SAM protein [Candidatus Lokiarchaeota archaeon]MBD3202297.1 radical SAM protein [Candidatus Lokiarchaeota archaeon]
MNTILVYPQLEFSGLQLATPPYSILFIADYIRRNGIDVEVFDMRFDNIRDLIRTISLRDPEYIGISVMTGPQIYFALNISEMIKTRFPEKKIVWGGIHPTILPTQTLKNKVIDYVIRGEGEKSYYSLISGVNKKRIKGLSLKSSRIIYHNPDAELLLKSDLNNLTIPWDIIDHQNYIKRGNFNMISSRGCPYRCAFCYNTLFNNFWRGWTAEKTIEELKKVQQFGAKKIVFYDDNFFAGKKRIEPLYEFFKNESIEWKAEIRVDQLNNKFAKRAKKHGCAQLFFGAESGSQRILDILNKNITVKDILNSAKITSEVDLFAEYSWMIGIPGEKWRDVQKTIAVIKKIQELNSNCEFSIKIMYPYPKTPIYTQAIKQGHTPPSSLIEWGKIRREVAPDYLNNRKLLEMISITSAVIGKKLFEENDIPILKLVRFLANLRWKTEVFNVGIENAFFKLFRKIIENFISDKGSDEYDAFEHRIVSRK